MVRKPTLGGLLAVRKLLGLNRLFLPLFMVDVCQNKPHQKGRIEELEKLIQSQGEQTQVSNVRLLSADRETYVEFTDIQDCGCCRHQPGTEILIHLCAPHDKPLQAFIRRHQHRIVDMSYAGWSRLTRWERLQIWLYGKHL